MSARLLHIGYPKAGSNWVRGWLAAHPGVAYREGGAEALAGAQGNPALLHAASDETLVFPSDPGEVLAERADVDAAGLAARQDAACARLAALLPDAQVLIVTRGFAGMLRSSYSQSVRTGADWDLPEHAARVLAAHPWHYDRLIAAYRAAFAGRVIVLPFELLAADPVRFGQVLAERLGLAPLEHLPPPQNPSLGPAELAWYPRLARLAARLPGGAALRGWQARAAFTNRWAGLVALLDHLSGTRAADVPPARLAPLRGDAEELCRDPLFAPYAAEYLAD